MNDKKAAVLLETTAFMYDLFRTASCKDRLCIRLISLR